MSVVVSEPSSTIVVEETNTIVAQDEGVEVIEVGIQGPPGSGGGGGGIEYGDPLVENLHGFIEVVRNKTYTVALKMAFPGTVLETTTKVISGGSCTATFDINGTPLGGTANSASTTEEDQAHASANTFAAGDTINLVASVNASCLDLAWSMKIIKTLSAS